MSSNPLTASELRAIGERVESLGMLDRPWTDAERDRARLYAALERLIIEDNDGKPFFVIRVPLRMIFRTKDAAIDALLLQGGGE